MYRQKLQERDTARLHIRDLQRSSQRVQRQIGQYQSRVEAAPMVEQELASLKREYELEKTHYADLTTRHQQARWPRTWRASRAASSSACSTPPTCRRVRRSREQLRIMAVAIVAGLVLGAAAAVGREFLDRSVHDARALERVRGAGARRDSADSRVEA